VYWLIGNTSNDAIESSRNICASYHLVRLIRSLFGQVFARVTHESEPGPLAPDVDALEVFNTACEVPQALKLSY